MENNVLGVVDIIVVDGSASNLDGAICDIVKEGTVMAHQHNAAATLGKELLEPLDGFDVEVVGRLVEEEEIRSLQEDLGEFDTHAPPSRELTSGAIEIGAFKAEAYEGSFDFGIAVLRLYDGELFVELGHSFDEVSIRLRLVVGARLQDAVHLGQSLLECYG